jgi:hypothetical protein
LFPPIESAQASARISVLLVFLWSLLLPVFNLQVLSAPSISMPSTHLLSPALLGNRALIISTNLGTNSLTTLPNQRTARVSLCCLSTLLTFYYYLNLCYCQEENLRDLCWTCHATPSLLRNPPIRPCWRREGEFLQSLDECRAELSLRTRIARQTHARCMHNP